MNRVMSFVVAAGAVVVIALTGVSAWFVIAGFRPAGWIFFLAMMAPGLALCLYHLPGLITGARA